MLQQTQVATVIPYYRRFLERFPTVRDLAAADLDAVLELWAGLGYYARARNLHRAAQAVVEQHAGRFPRTLDGLRGLPGVGDYTAGAIASIAFGERAAVVDGNVARVFSRLFCIRENLQGGPGRDRLWRVAEKLVPADRPGDFNQALMELGATVCLPKNGAMCLTCPLKSQCEAFAAGSVAELPMKKIKTPVKDELHVVAAIVDSKNRWLVIKRPTDGLWGGLWELPTMVATSSAARIDTASQAEMLADTLVDRDIEINSRPFCDITHQLTHRTVRFVGHVCRMAGRPVSARPSAKELHVVIPQRRWLPIREINAIGISTAMRKVLESLITINGTRTHTRLSRST